MSTHIGEYCIPDLLVFVLNRWRIQRRTLEVGDDLQAGDLLVRVNEVSAEISTCFREAAMSRMTAATLA